MKYAVFFLLTLFSAESTEISLNYSLTCKDEMIFGYKIELVELDPFFDDYLSHKSGTENGSVVGSIEGTDSLDGNNEFEFGVTLTHNCTAMGRSVICTYDLGSCSVNNDSCEFFLKREILELDHVHKLSDKCKY